MEKDERARMPNQVYAIMSSDQGDSLVRVLVDPKNVTGSFQVNMYTAP